MLTYSTSSTITFLPTGEPLVVWAKGWIDPGSATNNRVFEMRMGTALLDTSQQYSTAIGTNNIEFALMYASTTPQTATTTITISVTSTDTIQDPKIVVYEESA